MSIRFALIYKPDWGKQRVHMVEGDEVRVSLCGQSISTQWRYSRRSMAAIRKLPACGNCAAVLGAPKKRIARMASR